MIKARRKEEVSNWTGRIIDREHIKDWKERKVRRQTEEIETDWPKTIIKGIREANEDNDL